jgi:hypothetical protein
LQLKPGGRSDISDRWIIEAGATYFAGGSVTMVLPAEPSQTIAADYDHWSSRTEVGEYHVMDGLNYGGKPVSASNRFVSLFSPSPGIA